MISNFRKSLRSWATVGLLLIALIAIVITGFGTGGFGGLGSLTKSGSGDGSDALATVEGKAITAAEVSDGVNRAFARAHQQQPTLDMAGFLAQGAYEQVLNQAIVSNAIQAFADHQGLVISQTMIDREIANLPAFRNLTGQFDQNVYREQLRAMNMTEAKLREEIVQSLTQRQLLGPIALGGRAPEGVAREYANLLLERRTGTIAVVPTAQLAAGIAPTDAEIAAFYRTNRVAFTVPERRVIKYAVIGADQVAATPPATDAEIAAVYRNSPLRFGARETRTIQSIVLPSQQAADAFAAQVRGGTSFIAAAQQAGFAAADVTFADQNRTQFAAVRNPQIAAAAFSAAQGAVVGPTRTELGYHVMRIDHVTTVAARPLESVRGEIAAFVNQRKRAEALAALVQQAEEQLSSGASFEEVARAHNLTIVTTPPVTATGQAVDAGTPWTAPADLAPLLHSAFDIDAEDPEPAIETIAANERFAMLGIDRVVPAAPAPLAQITQQVREALIQQRARQAARALADRIVQRINSGTPAAQALAEAQPRIQNARQVDLRRGEINRQGQQTPPPLLVLFSLPEGHARVVPAENGAGWFIVFHAASHAGRRLDQRGADPAGPHPVQHQHQRGARPAIRPRDRAAQRRQPQRGRDRRGAPAAERQRDSAGELGADRVRDSILVLDNYDSFTWNLVHYLREIGAEVRVARNDSLSAVEAVASGAQAILISPGPGVPDDAGISLDLVAACAAARLPLLGVCLGHQAIGQHFGARIARAPRIMHGKVSAIEHDASGVFAGLPSPFAATRYHSLTVQPESIPDNLIVNARAEDGTVQGFRHAGLPIHGVQFHPESIASEHGHVLLANFLALSRAVAAAA